MKNFFTKTFCSLTVLIALLASLASFKLLEVRASYSQRSQSSEPSVSAITKRMVVNSDDRKDYYDVDDVLKGEAESVALLAMGAVIDKNKFKTERLDKVYMGLCSGELFRSQPIIYHKDMDKGWVCSSFLVAPDVIATAGHCIDMPMVTDDKDKKRLSDLRFVFGYRMQDAATAVVDARANETYTGKRFIGCSIGTDWSLIKLDRPVANHTPTTIAGTPLAAGQSIHVIGYPLGLPLKIAGNATVQPDFTESYFKADLDVFGGSSGSPVFNSSHQVIGILVKAYGNVSRDNSRNCLLSKKCDGVECPYSQSTRTAIFSECLANFDSPSCPKCFDWKIAP